MMAMKCAIIKKNGNGQENTLQEKVADLVLVNLPSMQLQMRMVLTKDANGCVLFSKM